MAFLGDVVMSAPGLVQGTPGDDFRQNLVDGVNHSSMMEEVVLGEPDIHLVFNVDQPADDWKYV